MGLYAYYKLGYARFVTRRKKDPNGLDLRKQRQNKGLLGLGDDGVKSTRSETPRSKNHYKLGLCVSPLLHKT